MRTFSDRRVRANKGALDFRIDLYDIAVRVAEEKRAMLEGLVGYWHFERDAFRL